MWGRKKTSCDGVANKNIFDSKLCNDFTNGSSKASFHQPRLRPKSFKKKPSPVGLGTALCDFLFSSIVTTITRRMETPLFLFLVCFSLDQFVLIISPFISTIWFCWKTRRERNNQNYCFISRKSHSLDSFSQRTLKTFLQLWLLC